LSVRRAGPRVQRQPVPSARMVGQNRALLVSRGRDNHYDRRRARRRMSQKPTVHQR